MPEYRRNHPIVSDVNPYTQWVYEHPERLLAEPTPEALAERFAAADAESAPTGGLVLDLGCGSGNFLLALARREPRRRFLGFELRYKRLVKAARKLERDGVRNVWLLREEAERFGAYVGAGTVYRLYVNFPDPWPKRAQWKKRLINPGFLDEVERVLAPEGRLVLKTDHSGYFLHSLAQVRDRPGLRLVDWCNDLHRTGAAEPDARTEFEQLFAAKRKQIFYLAVEKTIAAD